jgi:hypothetical protein
MDDVGEGEDFLFGTGHLASGGQLQLSEVIGSCQK